MSAKFQPDPLADEQAALWAARLEGSDLSAADRAALNAWLAESPVHRALLSNYCQFSADLEMQLPRIFSTDGLSIPAAPKPKRRLGSFPRIALAAAAIAVLCMLGYRVLKTTERVENFASLPGQRSTFTLADGTHVELNARTTLRFVNRGGERRARLMEGEAFFIVSKDKARPFVVETPSGSIRVTGTTFDVRTEATILDVTVLEGSVQVSPGPATGARESTSVALGSRDRLLASHGNVSVSKLSGDALDDVLAWREGMVVFAGEPMETALARFARYQGKSIRVSPSAGKLSVGGRYNLGDLDGFLAGVEESLGVGLRTSRDPSGALRVELRSE